MIAPDGRVTDISCKMLQDINSHFYDGKSDILWMDYSQQEPTMMSRTQTLYLHLGMSKTGTTYMQRRIFPSIQSLRYLDSPRSSIVEGEFYKRERILKGFLRRSPEVWAEFGEELFREFISNDKYHRFHSQEDDILWSDECVDAVRDPQLIEEHANQVKLLCSRSGISCVKVFVAVRRQADWIASSYVQHSDRIGDASQQDFERNLLTMINNRSGYYLDGNRLDYNKIKQYLDTGFGSQNVLMLPYEMFREDQERFIKAVLLFFDRDRDEVNQILSDLEKKKPDSENVRSSERGVWDLRQKSQSISFRIGPFSMEKTGLSPFFLPKWILPQTQQRIRVTSELESLVKAKFETSNRSLSSKLNIDLGSYGYY